MLERYRAALSLSGRSRANHPVVWIESDDWGNPTWSDLKALRRFFSWQRTEPRGMWDRDYCETDDDLMELAGALSSVRDASGRHPSMCMNVIVGEPDYNEAGRSRGGSYAWKKGQTWSKTRVEWLKEQTVFHLELHGLEHFNPTVLLRHVGEGDDRLRWFLGEGIVPPGGIVGDYPGLGAALLPMRHSKNPGGCDSAARLEGAVSIFGDLFGRRPEAFAPPNHCWDDTVERILTTQGVRFIQAANVQYGNIEAYEAGRYRTRIDGCKGAAGAIYLIRNVAFEPASNSYDPGEVLRRIKGFLKRRIPVVIGTHRANYTGVTISQNSRNSLGELKALLSEIVRSVPGVRFLSPLSGGALYDVGVTEEVCLVGRSRVSCVGELIYATLRPKVFKDLM